MGFRVQGLGCGVAGLSQLNGILHGFQGPLLHLHGYGIKEPLRHHVGNDTPETLNPKPRALNSKP